MRFVRIGFWIAGLYGLAATLPMYPGTPPADGAIWYYGFVGAAAATQLLYLLIATDPARFRPAIPVGIASKLSFAVPALILFGQGAVGRPMLLAAAIDLALAAFFGWAFVRLNPAAPAPPSPHRAASR